MNLYTTDTSPEAAALQLEAVRKMTGTERVAKALALTSQMMRLSKAAIRRRHPDFSDAELKLRFIELHYGKELASAVRQQRAAGNECAADDERAAEHQ